MNKESVEFYTNFPIGKVTLIAKDCHEANRAYSESNGDYSHKSWEDSPAWQKQSIINGVLFKLRHKHSAPEDQHKQWLKDKQDAGWKYAIAYDDKKKQHPGMCSYNLLPPVESAKYLIFVSIVSALSNLVD